LFWAKQKKHIDPKAERRLFFNLYMKKKKKKKDLKNTVHNTHSMLSFSHKKDLKLFEREILPHILRDLLT